MKRWLGAVWLGVMLALTAAPWGSAVAAFEPPGLLNDAQAYANALRAKAPPQPNDQKRLQALAAADEALSRRDFAKAIKGYEEAIFYGESTVATWLKLSQAWGSLDQPNPQRALQSAYQAYRLDQNQDPPLLRLASVFEQLLDRPAQALAALQVLKEREAKVEGLEERIKALKLQVGLTLKQVRVLVEDDPPRLCLELSDAPSDSARVHFEDFVRLEPAVALSIERKDDGLCLSGIDYGTRYQLSLRQGLPGVGGLVLKKDETQTVRVGDRAPLVAFKGEAFILPRLGGGGIPVQSTNLDQVGIKLYRINDRNLAAQVNGKRITQALGTYSAKELADQDGELIWQGKIAVKNQRNKSVTTALPVREILGELKPGLYVLTGEPADVAEELVPYDKATQWLMVTDLGLTTVRGADGLNVFVRSLGTAKPRAQVELSLLARNNAVLATTVTDADGHARFDPGLIRAKGGNGPVAVLAYGGGGDFALLDLTLAAFDLSDRGVGGRQPPGPLDAYLYSDRGVYRPGETVNLTVLLRDDRTAAVENFPLTAKVFRPSGTEFFSGTLRPNGAGGYALPVSLDKAAPMGGWQVKVYGDPKGEPVGHLGFQVEDFVPERLALEVNGSAPLLQPGQPFQALVKGRFLYGPPAAGLNGTAELSLGPDNEPFPNRPGYHFGLAQEAVTPRLVQLVFPTSDATGLSPVEVTLPPLPDTTRQLKAEIRVTMAEPGGRPSRKAFSVPVRTQPYLIGIKAGFEDERIAEGSPPSFELIALTPDGTPVAHNDLKVELIREEVEYRWFLENGRYNFRSITHDRSQRLTKASPGAAGPARVSFPALDYGRYRLEVSDPASGVASSLRFTSGWVVGPTTSDTPDKLEVLSDKASYAPGEQARVKLSPPFAGEVLLTVATDRLWSSRTLSVPAEGTTVEIPVSAEWGPGAYVTATVYRPPVPGKDRLPVRAIGLTWLGVDTAARTFKVALDVPEVVRPRQTVEIPLKVTPATSGGPALDHAYLTLAAVDEGILQLTDFVSPDPGRHFFGKRALGLDIRDDYGRLIDPSDAAAGELRQGGDTGGAGLPEVPVTVVSLFSGVVKLNPDGSARIPVTLPAFNGQLRLMAVAWDATRLGSSAGKVIVRDPLVAQLTLPRFLAPGDDSRLTLSLHNVEAAPGAYQVRLDSRGPITLGNPGDNPTFTLDLAQGQRLAQVVPLHGTGAGIAEVTATVAGPNLPALSQSLKLTVRPARPVETDVAVRRLEPGAVSDSGIALLAPFVAGTAGLSLTYSAAPPFDVPGILRALDRYPFGCLEQLVSRALPLLSVNDVTLALGPDRKADDSLEARVDQAIVEVLDKQRFDGAFGLWSSRDEAEPWLTAYALEFLTRARARHHAVPDAPYLAGLTWLREHAINGGTTPEDLAARAYALHVLALAGQLTPAPARYFHDAFLDRLPTPLARAQLAAALSRLGDAERARAAAERAFKALARDWWRSDYGSTVRDAAALVTVLGEVGLTRERLNALIDRLPASETTVKATNTQERAWLVQAAQTLMSGSKPLQLTITGRATPSGDPVYLLPAVAELNQGLSVRNAGSGAIWQAVATYGVPALPQPAAREGLKIKRGFFNRDGSPLNLDTIKQNDVFVITLEGEATTKLYHQVMVVHPLPAGWEIENTKLGAAGTSDLPWLGELSQPLMAAARDDRYLAALDLSAESPGFKLAYLVRAVTPGSYELPGAQVEDMYQPRFFARQAVGRITVLPAN